MGGSVQQVTTVEGEVFRRLYAVGSKSEHEAVMIRTSEGEFLLRRAGGNAFQDSILDQLVGTRIKGTGRRLETVVILDQWEVLQTGAVSKDAKR